MPVDIAALRRRWRRLMPGPAVPQSDGVFDRLVAAYSGTGRHSGSWVALSAGQNS